MTATPPSREARPDQGSPGTLGLTLLHALRDHGAHEIFGILPFYTLSHEPAVGFKADAAARFGGGLSIAVATWGAGASNLVNPMRTRRELVGALAAAHATRGRFQMLDAGDITASLEYAARQADHPVLRVAWRPTALERGETLVEVT